MKAGDRILLDDGLYVGNFTLLRAGSTSSPIVIRPLRKMSARISTLVAGNDVPLISIGRRALEGNPLVAARNAS